MNSISFLNYVNILKQLGSLYFQNKLKNINYNLEDKEFSEVLINLSLTKDYSLPSKYFGIYFLDKQTQSKYLIKDEDGIPELRFDLFDKEGWNEIKNSNSYEIILKKSDNKILEKAYELLMKNEKINTINNPIENKPVYEKFASNLEIITNLGGLSITLRNASMKSKIKMEAKQTKEGYEVYILNHYKLYDEFKEPYNIKVVDAKIVDIILLSKKETGNPYAMSSGYRDRYILKRVFKNRKEALEYIKKRIK